MAKRTRKLDQYFTGTGNTGLGNNYIQSPAQVLQKDKQNKAQAKYEAMTDPLVMGTGIAGNIAMQAGLQAGGAGQLGIPEGLEGLIPLLGNLSFANGGIVPSQTTVEVEDEEIAEMPNGQLMQFEGATHEQGGIDTTLPVGTKIYSDRISVDGKTMQQRKAKREKLIKKLTKAGDTASDVNTLKRTQTFLDKEDQGDLMIQQMANMATDPKKFAYGSNAFGVGEEDPIKDIFGGNILAPLAGGVSLPTSFTPTKPLAVAPMNLTSNTPDPGDEGGGNMGLSAGDMLGIAGQIGGGIAPILSTLNNRANTDPNVNSYANYGQEGLEVLDQNKNYIQGQKDNALNRVTLNKNTVQSVRRNGARGINQMRAMDLATEQEAGLAENNIYDTFSRQMMGILGQEAQMENIQDQVVMGGEAQRDLADRQDNDAFSTNMSAATSNLFTQLQAMAGSFNKAEERQDMLDIMPDTNKYGLGYTRKKGKFTQKKSK